MRSKIVKQSLKSFILLYCLHMSDNHYIDVSFVKTENESSLNLEICETRYSLIANFGKFESISFSEEVLIFKFTKGHLRIDMTVEEMCKYLILKDTKKEE